MAFESEDQKAAAIQFGTNSPFWQEFYLPALQSKAKQMMELLASKPSELDNITRGWIQALRWAIALPTQEVSRYHAEAEARVAEQRQQDVDNYRAEIGSRSPYPSEPDGPTPSAEETSHA